MADNVYYKPALSIGDQIQQLQDRGLIISDIEIARHFLSQISYYRLAGYWWTLQNDEMNHAFKEGARFETVIYRYNFDRELRLLVFDVIERLEISFRAKLIYEMSIDHRAWWFQDSSLFKNKDHHESMLAVFEGEVLRSKELFMSEHFKNYKDDLRLPPAWKTFEVLTMGTLSKMYGNILPSCKAIDRIADSYGVVNHKYLRSWLQSVTEIRNICAHHGRLWNRNLPSRPKFLPNPPNSWLLSIPNTQERFKIYYHLSCMKYLMNCVSPNSRFFFRLYALLKKYDEIPIEQMGFPENWYKEPVWTVGTTPLQLKTFATMDGLAQKIVR